MAFPFRTGLLAVLGALAWTASAPAQSVEQLQQRIEEMQRNYDRQIAEIRHDYETRIRTLETDTEELRAEAPQTSSLERMIQDLQDGARLGIAEFGQLTVFDARFNPAVSLVGDFVLAASSRDDSYDQLNRFALRDVELGLIGRVDPFVAYYVFIHFEEDDIELEEAYGWADDWLPGTLSLKFGRFNMDFGKQSPIHDHDLPYVDKPGVLQEFLGGALRGTGVELHHWFPLGDSGVFRWSANVVNDLDGDSHPILGPLADDDHHEDEEGREAFGEREFDDFAFKLRGTAIFDLTDTATFQVGASAAWAPDQRTFLEPHAAGALLGLADDDAFDAKTEKLTIGLDLTFRWLDPATGEGLTIGAEGLFNNQSFVIEDDDAGAAPLTTDTIGAFGFYVYGEYFLDPRWSFGASFDWFERASDDDEVWWDIGAFVTWRVTHFNRIRLEVRYIEDDLLGEEYTTVMLQWTTILGSHGHGLEF